jgi:hypothetical protein
MSRTTTSGLKTTGPSWTRGKSEMPYKMVYFRTCVFLVLLAALIGAGAALAVVYYSPSGPVLALESARVELDDARRAAKRARDIGDSLEFGLQKAIIEAEGIRSASDRIVILARAIREVASGLRGLATGGALPNPSP